MAEKKSVFETLSNIDVSRHVETIKMNKGPALKYVSWAWAWAIVKRAYPDAKRTIEEYPEYRPDKDGRWYATGQKLDYRITPAGCEVKVTVTIEGEEYTERLYVMDMRNQPVQNPNIAQINKTQQRCLVKALAMAGLGLNLYAGEDLPMGDLNQQDEKQAEKKQEANAKKAKIDAWRKQYSKNISLLTGLMGIGADEVEKAVKGRAAAQLDKIKKPTQEQQWQIAIAASNDLLGEAGYQEQQDVFEEA